MVKCSWWKLFYYSHIENRKSFWERFNWVLTLKMDFESRKMPIFKGVASDHFTRYQKILWTCLLGCKKLLNFICLPMKFHNRVYLNLDTYFIGYLTPCPSTKIASLTVNWTTEYSHCPTTTLYWKSKTGSQFLDIWSIFARQTTFHLENWPNQVSFFVNPV